MIEVIIPETLTADLKAEPLWRLASRILIAWPKPYFGAVPYLNAMRSLSSMSDSYGEDSAHSIVAYFLSNASTWRGPEAKAIKAELNRRLKVVK
jgi:hypothetical protein